MSKGAHSIRFDTHAIREFAFALRNVGLLLDEVRLHPTDKPTLMAELTAQYVALQTKRGEPVIEPLIIESWNFGTGPVKIWGDESVTPGSIKPVYREAR